MTKRCIDCLMAGKIGTQRERERERETKPASAITTPLAENKFGCNTNGAVKCGLCAG
jgi:hypothetical protein